MDDLLSFIRNSYKIHIDIRLHLVSQQRNLCQEIDKGGVWNCHLSSIGQIISTILEGKDSQ